MLYTEPCYRTVINDELEVTSVEAVAPCFEALLQHLIAGTEENHDKPQLG